MEVVDFAKWLEESKDQLQPPVCNKLLFNGQLKVQVVGGPNKRQDYHMEEGEEFFYQFKGNMYLPIVEEGKHKRVDIKEGQMFLLPPRLPHSPQREENSIGLVVERERREKQMDGMRWYVGCEEDKLKPTNKVLYEEFFHCTNLAKDLPPVINRFKSSEACKTNVPPSKDQLGHPNTEQEIPIKIDTVTHAPQVRNFKDWIKQNYESKHFPGERPICQGKDFEIIIQSGECVSADKKCQREVLLWLIEGSAEVTLKNKEQQHRKVGANSMVLIHADSTHSVKLLDQNSLCLKLFWEGNY